MQLYVSHTIRQYVRRSHAWVWVELIRRIFSNIFFYINIVNIGNPMNFGYFFIICKSNKIQMVYHMIWHMYCAHIGSHWEFKFRSHWSVTTTCLMMMIIIMEYNVVHFIVVYESIQITFSDFINENARSLFFG